MLKRGDLIVLESTSPPGTTEEILVPILEDGSGFKAGEDFHVAYCPERVLPDKRICHALDMDVWQVIELANLHPRVNILKPGPGVGGHCIAVDPWFIVEKAPKEAKLIKTARLRRQGRPRSGEMGTSRVQGGDDMISI